MVLLTSCVALSMWLHLLGFRELASKMERMNGLERESIRSAYPVARHLGNAHETVITCIVIVIWVPTSDKRKYCPSTHLSERRGASGVRKGRSTQPAVTASAPPTPNAKLSSVPQPHRCQPRCCPRERFVLSSRLKTSKVQIGEEGNWGRIFKVGTFSKLS